jgi:two-component system sensor histidine kinase YesM
MPRKEQVINQMGQEGGNMRFQTRIILVYAALVFALAAILGLTFYRINTLHYERNEEENLDVTVTQLVKQMDEKLDQMAASMNYVISNPSILEGIVTLGTDNREFYDSTTIQNMKSAIRSGINTDYIVSHCYRTVVFNQLGDFISTHNSSSPRVIKKFDNTWMPYLQQVDRLKGKPLIVNTHKDYWGYDKNPQVYSLVKAVLGHNTGYIEISNRAEDLKNLQVPGNATEYLIVVNGNEQLYSSSELLSVSRYEKFIQTEGEFTIVYKETDQLISKAVSDKYAITILAFESIDVIRDNNRYVLFLTILVAFIFFGVSLFFVIFFSAIITKPIRQLRLIMENTRLENLNEDVTLITSNDEIEALTNSYRDVMERLQKSMVKEKRLSLLQLQAQFDSLQAQVNPHLIYNVLNIISARGMADDDEMICEMCGSLAEMLRYSTNNKNRYATICQEMEYLDKYFYLLKARYEDKICCTIAVEEGVTSQIIPKMTLQQIVENCINHAFENSTEQMRIDINGYIRGDHWFVSVKDNGQGFMEDSLCKLQQQMEEIKTKILMNTSNMEMEIGGMGLINVYARCLLLYNEHLIFQIKNANNGAEVIVGTKFALID